MRRLGRWAALGFAGIALAGVIGWSALAIYDSNLPWPAARLTLSFVFPSAPSVP